MRLRNRLPELLLLTLALLFLAALFYPFSSASLPALPARAPVPDSEQAGAAPGNPDPLPSIPETASLFMPYHPAHTGTPQKQTAPPEKVPWLHFIAYVVGSSGQTVYFFKNDQTSRVLMLAWNQPREGWSLIRIEADACILERDNRSYVVVRK